MRKAQKDAKPPRIANWLLESLCSYDYLPGVHWDLEELFESNVATKGLGKAKLIYTKEVLSIIIHLFFKGKSQYSNNSIAMLKHNILITFRNFKRHKGSLFINLFGLATGISSALLIYLWVNDEMQVGHYQEKFSDQHYQVFVNKTFSSGIVTRNFAPMPLAKAMEADLPEVEKGIPIIADAYYKGVLTNEGKNLRAIPLFAGEGYLDVFQCDLIAGNKASALKYNEVIITKNLANSLFNSAENAIGRTVHFQNEYANEAYIVTGVFEPSDDMLMPHDILLSFDQFLSWRPENDNWYNGGTQVHLVLKEDVQIDQFNLKIEGFLKNYQQTSDKLFVQKYTDTHLYGKYENGQPVDGRISYLRIFSWIAVFILIIASINYMNLTTARATSRLREIGVKKAVGASRRALIYQHFSESIVITFLSLILAGGIVALLLPHFNVITGKSMALLDLSEMVLPAILLTLFTGLVSGIYPGFYLSGFKTVFALKGKPGISGGNQWFRKGLVIFQFSVSIVLIISVVVIYQQVSFLRASNLGYDQEYLISFNREGKLYEGSPEAFMEEVQNLTGVVNISYLWGELPGGVSGGSGMRWDGMDPDAASIDFSFIEGGFDMATVLGVDFKEGRPLSKEYSTDRRAVVINEEAAELIGYNDAVGKSFYNGDETGQIVGVIKNFHFEGLHQEIGPFFFMYTEDGDRFMAKIRGENQLETINQIKQLHENFNPGYPFEYSFVDQNYQKVYEEEQRISTLSHYFSAIAITISCLGLLALTAFSSQRRFKEIAIRKILGSDNLGIMRLLSKEFILPVVIAILLAAPLAYYLMKTWLDGFAYRIALEPSYFVLSGALILLIAWLTILSQIVNTARVNVTESLKTDS